MNNTRIKWLDNVRGIAIFLVVIGHVFTRIGNTGIERLLQITIYSFHMPLFFFLSGYVFKVKDDKLTHLISCKAKRLLIPMLIYYLVYAIFFIIKLLLGMVSLELSLSLVLNTFFMTSNSFFNNYWFLPVLFCTQIIFEVIYRCVHDKSTQLVIFLVIVLFVSSRILHLYSIVLPLGITEAMIALPFFTLGYYARNSYVANKIFEKVTNVNVGGCIVEFAVYIVFVAALVKVLHYNCCHMVNSDIGNPVEFLLLGTIGSMICVSVGKKFVSIFSEFCGRNSLDIYGFHYIPLDIYANVMQNFQIYNIVLKILIDLVGAIVIIAISLMPEFIKGLKKERIYE